MQDCNIFVCDPYSHHKLLHSHTQRQRKSSCSIQHLDKHSLIRQLYRTNNPHQPLYQPHVLFNIAMRSCMHVQKHCIVNDLQVQQQLTHRKLRLRGTGRVHWKRCGSVRTSCRRSSNSPLTQVNRPTLPKQSSFSYNNLL